MTPDLRKEHKWLEQLVGDWTCEMEAVMGPDQPPSKSKGTESVRSLDGAWTLGEGRAEMPGGGTATNIMTLGFDPSKGRFIGTFIASCMTHLWVYEGSLDESGKVLTLDTQGPSFTAPGKMAAYKDVIEIVDPGYRKLSSSVQMDDGSWVSFMTAHYRRA
jgi:hypothetical protein